MSTTGSKNPLSAFELGSFDLTDKGLFHDNMQILSALKTSQRRFCNRILKFHPELRKPELFNCGTHIFFRRFRSGDRVYAGGIFCQNPLCPLCAFRRAQISAAACYEFVKEQMRRNPCLFPVLHHHGLVEDFLGVPSSSLAQQFKNLKRDHRKDLRTRQHRLPFVAGSIGFYHFGSCFDCGDMLLTRMELHLVMQPSPFDRLSISEQNLRKVIFDLFLCRVINSDGSLTRNQQFQATNLIKDSAQFVPYGIFNGFSNPAFSVTDSIPDSFSDQTYDEEQYRYDVELKEYVLCKVNTGENMQFPFEEYSKPGYVGRGRRSRKAAAGIFYPRARS